MGAGASKDGKQQGGKEKKGKRPATKNSSRTARPDSAAGFGSPEQVQDLAEQTNLSVPEVHALCQRFIELGIDEEDMVPITKFMEHSDLDGGDSRIVFQRFLALVPAGNGRPDNDINKTVQIGTFLQIAKFWKLAPVAKKLERIFDLFDIDGDGVLNVSDIRALLQDAASDGVDLSFEDDEAMDQAARLLLAQMRGGQAPTTDMRCKKKQFMQWALTIPEDELNEVLAFGILAPGGGGGDLGDTQVVTLGDLAA